MFTAASFMTVKKWKQPKFPSSNEWINKMWYVYTLDYYSSIKKWSTVAYYNKEKMLSEKANHKRSIFYETTYVEDPEKENM